MYGQHCDGAGQPAWLKIFSAYSASKSSFIIAVRASVFTDAGISSSSVYVHGSLHLSN